MPRRKRSAVSVWTMTRMSLWMAIAVLGLSGCESGTCGLADPQAPVEIRGAGDAEALAACEVLRDVHIAGSVSLPDLRRVEGSLTIAIEGDASSVNLSALTEVTGNLIVKYTAPSTERAHGLNLSGLQRVSGTLWLDDLPFGNLSLPIQEVGWIMRVTRHHRAGALAFPNLTTIGNNLEVGICFRCDEVVIGEGGPTLNEGLTGLSLPALTQVKGELRLSYNPALETLDLGLLEIAERGLSMWGPSKLRSVELPSLKQAGEILAIGQHEALTLIEVSDEVLAEHVILSGNHNMTHLGLAGLREVRGLTVRDNNRLESIEFADAERVSDLLIEDNPSLTQISMPALDYTNVANIRRNANLRAVEFPALTSFLNVLAFGESDRLAQISLPALVRGNALRLESLPSFRGLYTPSLQTIFTITIDHCDTLEHFIAPPVEVLGGLYFEANPRLLGLDLSAVTHLLGLRVIKNPALLHIDLSGWRVATNPEDTSFWHDVAIEGNERLVALTLPALTELGGMFKIENNAALRTFEAPALTHTYGLQLHANPQLALIDLPQLATIGAEGYEDGLDEIALHLSGDDALETLSMPSLEHIHGSLRAVSCASLTSLEAPALTHVEEMLEIADNPALDTLDLSALTAVGHLSITDNLALSECDADGVRLQLDLSVEEVSIEGNRPEEACDPGERP